MQGKKKFIYITFIILILLLTGFQISRKLLYRVSADFFHPYFSSVTKLETFAGRSSLLFKDKTSLVAEIYNLRIKNDELSAKNEYLNVIEKENNELRQLLKLPKKPGFDYVFSQVINRDPSQWYQQFTVNKGSDDGVVPGAVVLAPIANEFLQKNYKTKYAVAGRVSSVSGHSAVVDTIVSDSVRLSVYLPASGATGIIQGGGIRGSRMWSNIQFLPRDLPYNSGDKVITSGLSKSTPPSLSVGELFGENYSGVSFYNRLFVIAKMKPLVDLDHLNFVLILVKK